MSKLNRSRSAPSKMGSKKRPSRQQDERGDTSEGKVGNFIRNAFSQSSGGHAKLTHRAYEIIPRNSPYGHHFRAMLNAENFVSDHEDQMALDIYQRLLNKIPLRSAREKIEQNIEDIENFLDSNEDLPTPKVALDVNFGSPFNNAPESPPQDQTQAGQAPAPSTPIQIQIGGPPPTGAPGGGGMPGAGGPGAGAPGAGSGFPYPFSYPFLPPPGMADYAAEQKKKEDEIPKPFGFFQQQDEAEEKREREREAKKPDLKSFFDSAKSLPDAEMMKKTNHILEDISDGIFNIEKALFDANKMDVETEKVEEEPVEEEEVEQEPAIEEKAEDEKKSDADFPTRPIGGAMASEAPRATGEPGEDYDETPAPPSGEPTTEEAPEEEIEKSEGVMEQSSALSSLDDGEGSDEFNEDEVDEEESPQVQEIRGVLELKEPEQEDTPFITITYDFAKIPHGFYLSKDHNILEYAYYKYKPMLVKAQKFIRKKQITRALNYYRVIRDQQIPDALRDMIDRNIRDISEYLEKYLMTRPV